MTLEQALISAFRSARNEGQIYLSNDSAFSWKYKYTSPSLEQRARDLLNLYYTEYINYGLLCEIGKKFAAGKYDTKLEKALR